MKGLFKIIIPLFITGVSIILLARCGKNATIAKEQTTSVNSATPYLLQGPCPYNCHDSRCQAYSQGYCGPGPANFQTMAATQVMKSALQNAFNALPSTVDMAALSTQMGLSSTITADSLDFVNVNEAFDANNAGVVAIVASFKSNSNSKNNNYAFYIYYDGTNYFNPTFVSTVYKNSFIIFDCQVGYKITCTNFTSSNFAFTGDSVSYMGGVQSASVTVNSIGSSKKAVNKLAGCGQQVMNCMADAYSNHGWWSVAATIASAIDPACVAAAAAACAILHC